MTWNNKVIWSEGMLLQPQHLQQQDRYWRAQLDARCAGLQPYGYGFSVLKIDEQQLKLGKFSLLECAGVLADGTSFNLPADDDLPAPIDIPETARGILVNLALPTRRPGIPESANEDLQENFARYRLAEFEATSSHQEATGAVLMHVGKLRFQLTLETQAMNAYTLLGVARLIERLPDNQVVLDPTYIAPCLDYRISRRLASFVDEFVGLLHQRAEVLANRLAQPDLTGVAEIADFLMLQLVNRNEPLWLHYSTMTGLHPELLYQSLLQLAGELTTFSRPNKRPGEFPIYRHDKLRETFEPVMESLRSSLSMVMNPNAILLPLEEHKFGLRVATLSDPELFKSAAFVLAVKANLPAQVILNRFTQQVKIGPVERIRDLVNLQLPGINLRALSVVPRQLPFHAGFTYFELDRSDELWHELTTSAGLAVHIVGEFPGLEVELWAVRL
ncbi:MAG: type VI secretion system protein ImpJ [Glomeribacter sp. 1016415]|nr:type VI secretion system protein ImpJ [Glomeribacter sp. 1016415]